MDIQAKLKLKSKPKVDLRVQLLKSIIQRKDVIVIDDGYSYDDLDFDDEEERNLKRQLEEPHSGDNKSKRSRNK